MKRKMGKLMRTMGSGLEAQNADAMIYTWRTLDVLQPGAQKTAPDPEKTGQKALPRDHVTLYVVPSLLEQK